MRQRSNAPLLFFFLSFAYLFSAPIAEAKTTEVVGIRYWSTPTYTRIVIDVSEKTEFTWRLLNEDPAIQKPRRLYVDVHGASLAPQVEKAITIGDGLLKETRAGQHDKDTVRVVLDIEKISDYKVFSMSEPFRIVIDVEGNGGARIEDKKDDKTSERQGAKPFVRRIVIDAGHGGKDSGALGKKGLKEKDVVLEIAERLKKSMGKTFDSVDIMLTRSGDVFIPLEERTAIANTADADIFISIHANASPSHEASGVETYFLDMAHDKEAMRLAARENSATAEATDDLQFILMDLIKTANRNESSRLANEIQHSLVASLRKKHDDVKSNGVKGAPFFVLVRTKMPSVLVEVSFISNPVEEKRLNKDYYLDLIVDGIKEGVLKYINSQGKV
ncbi:MAG: N-acetylmuramoyl-L-alanine amidase [Deltaproteobacteria bacterium]|nr:N-acetylmuramoyl-L-alanine amidase [Deltaproteobacteria bacterium]